MNKVRMQGARFLGSEAYDPYLATTKELWNAAGGPLSSAY